MTSRLCEVGSYITDRRLGRQGKITMEVRVIRTMRKMFLQILSNWNSYHWVLLSLILLSSGLQSIPSSPSFQSRYPAVCKLLSPCQCCILCCCGNAGRVHMPWALLLRLIYGHWTESSISVSSGLHKSCYAGCTLLHKWCLWWNIYPQTYSKICVRVCL